MDSVPQPLLPPFIAPEQSSETTLIASKESFWLKLKRRFMPTVDKKNQFNNFWVPNFFRAAKNPVPSRATWLTKFVTSKPSAKIVPTSCRGDPLTEEEQAMKDISVGKESRNTLTLKIQMQGDGSLDS
jgi:hypothetical protein